MKRFLLISTFLVVLFFCSTNFVEAQNVIDFEDLTVPVSGYFNGSTLHSGTIGSTEKFEYSSQSGIFKVYYTLENGYDYWSGTAYSNQTNLTTADWTNFSAYANYPNGGGANNSANYGFSYMWNPNFVQPFSDTISFALPTCNCLTSLKGIYVTNTVWNYHYINGTDGSGTGKYTTGDYYKIIFKSLNLDNSFTGRQVEFYLADFTNGNSNIISNWTFVDLSELGETYKIEMVYESSDEWTPSYFCFDNIELEYINEILESEKSNLEIYPNPTSDFIYIKNIEKKNIKIYDISGRILDEIFVENQKIDFSNFKAGIYFISVETENGIKTQKIIIE